MAPGFFIVLNLAQDFHAALDVCNGGTVAALHCLVKVSRNNTWV